MMVVALFATCATAQAAPNASFTNSPSSWALAGQTVTFDASNSAAGAGRTLASYQWDFDGNGSWDATGVGPTITHQYTAGDQGVRLPKLRVTDDLGAVSGTVGHGFEVWLSQPPSPMFNLNVVAVANAATTFDASASSDSDGSVARYDWDWNADGVVDNSTTSPTIQHTFTVAETRNIRLYVVDNTGDITSLTKIGLVVHASQPPIAQLTLPAYGVSGQAVTFDASASSDPDGTISQYEWDFQATAPTTRQPRGQRPPTPFRPGRQQRQRCA